MILIQVIDNYGRMWLIPISRIVAYRPHRDLDHGTLYCIVMVDGVDSDHKFRAPIPMMYSQSTDDFTALANWVAAMMNRPTGVTNA